MMMEFLLSLWIWWSHAVPVLPYWDPYGAVFAIVLLLAVLGAGVKWMMGDD
ncbi:MAG: hypothetical protein QF578_08610 [Alphaproteobacteria bacterium]|jgi:hypothetical protein|nr:hypothetical protein [Alphaproteobacteria bacterium]MDP6815317.1 hypothetical protein [Alphaproteobacteria bacterium]|tara:strand:+ start:257 stop:409 length:153 start_codon:yes stop_codon:yes gene_type:complete